MISTVLGFNTAIIKQNDNFLALALKIKRGDNTCQTYYLQYATLNDLLIILNNQMQRVAHRLIEQEKAIENNSANKLRAILKPLRKSRQPKCNHRNPGGGLYR